jgi:hypothetical protein
VPEALEAILAAGELPSLLGDDDVELGGEAGRSGAGRARRAQSASVWASRRAS